MVTIRTAFGVSKEEEMMFVPPNCHRLFSRVLACVC